LYGEVLGVDPLLGAVSSSPLEALNRSYYSIYLMIFMMAFLPGLKSWASCLFDRESFT
jgi:hypothetical protein